MANGPDDDRAYLQGVHEGMIRAHEGAVQGLRDDMRKLSEKMDNVIERHDARIASLERWQSGLFYLGSLLAIAAGVVASLVGHMFVGLIAWLHTHVDRIVSVFTDHRKV